MFILLFSFKTFGGDDVNNGGGLAEQRVTHAYLQIESYIDLCLVIKDCHIGTKEREVLLLIKSQLTKEKEVTDQLQFISEKKKPGFFIIDGEIKMAKTGDTIGSPIFFNLDLLYWGDSLKAISLNRAIAILIHELGHHNNQIIDSKNDHTFLDLLGNKVALTYAAYNLTTPLTASHRDIELKVFNQINSDKGFPNILLRVNNKLVNISSKVQKSLKCTKFILPLGVQILGGKPKSAEIHNLHWTSIKEKTNSWKFNAVGNLSNFCKDDNNLLHMIKKFKVKISFKAKKLIQNKKVVLTLTENSITIKQIYDPWIKFFDIPII